MIQRVHRGSIASSWLLRRRISHGLRASHASTAAFPPIPSRLPPQRRNTRGPMPSLHPCPNRRGSLSQVRWGPVSAHTTRLQGGPPSWLPRTASPTGLVARPGLLSRDRPLIRTPLLLALPPRHLLVRGVESPLIRHPGQGQAARRKCPVARPAQTPASPIALARACIATESIPRAKAPPISPRGYLLSALICLDAPAPSNIVQSRPTDSLEMVAALTRYASMTSELGANRPTSPSPSTPHRRAARFRSTGPKDRRKLRLLPSPLPRLSAASLR